MKSALIALFTLGLVSLSTPLASEPSAPTVKVAGGTSYKLNNGWRMFVHGDPPDICALMKIQGANNEWGIGLVRNKYQQWVLQITNMTWLIPGPAPIQFTIQFGDEIPWEQKGMSVNTKTVQTEVGKEFIYRWIHHKTLKLTLNGSPVTWNLLGTKTAQQTLDQCVQALPKLSKPVPGMDS